MMFESARAMTVPFLIVASVLIAIEFGLSVRQGIRLYQPKDSLCNAFILLVSKLSQPLFLGYTYGTLKTIEQFRLFEIPDTIATGFLAVLLTDFVYYWEHRASHSFRALWFFHEVHHSSKNFNLTTSFRLHWLNKVTAPIFFAPLIFLGFKSEQLVVFFVANLFYQFLLHTKMVGKLGPLEGVINTPSAHRVHHARNTIYIDKNFGGILMLWDRLFGTYQFETETPEFGILGSFESNNPLTVQFHNMPGYAGLVSTLSKIKTGGKLASFITVVFLSGAVSASANAQNKPEDLNTAPANAPRVRTPLEGHLQANEEIPSENELIGLWNAEIKEYSRHPKVTIESMENGQFEGTYKGLLGKFPLHGSYDRRTESLQVYVDFSKAKLRFMRRGRSQTAIAVMNGKLVNGNTIIGTATLAELGTQEVHFEAHKKDAPIQIGIADTQR